MSSHYYPPYVPVGERRRLAQAAAKKISKSGRACEPVCLPTKKIATTFWGKAWCDNLEAYSDFENRLPRGRSYVRNGSVIDLQIMEGKVEALVQGSNLYKIKIGFKTLEPARWKTFKARCACKVTNLLDLLQGQLSKEILSDITSQDTGLFPSPSEIDLDCSCPDWAEMCKHVAAVLYGVGARLDEKPDLFFTLRGVKSEELISAVGDTASITGAIGKNKALDPDDLGDIFGVEIESGAPSPVAASTKGKSNPKPSRLTPVKPVPKPKSKLKAAAVVVRGRLKMGSKAKLVLPVAVATGKKRASAPKRTKQN